MNRLSAATLAAAAATLVCCGLVATDIGEILDDPRSHDGGTVTISGEVTESANLVVLKYYVLSDGTGEIVVVTDRAVPERGASMRVRGVVHQAFSLGDRRVVVLKEQ